MNPETALYAGDVAHHRLTPAEHRFKYKMFMTLLNLDDSAEQRAAQLGWWQRLGLARFTRKDHLGNPHEPLLASVQALVTAEVPGYERGPVALLTHLRQFGFRFNPVNFYFCFEPDGRSIAAIVLEVNNTPWGEQHTYVLNTRALTSPYELRTDKTFHVSPFMPMEMTYRFRFDLNGDRLRVVKENWQGEQRVFSAVLDLHRAPLDPAGFSRAMLQFPLMTFKVSAAIYWEALKLLIKRVPLHPHIARTRS